MQAKPICVHIHHPSIHSADISYFLKVPLTPFQAPFRTPSPIPTAVHWEVVPRFVCVGRYFPSRDLRIPRWGPSISNLNTPPLRPLQMDGSGKGHSCGS